MKKVSLKYILMQIIFVLGVGCLVAGIIQIATGYGFSVFMVLVTAVLGSFVLIGNFQGSIISELLMENTVEKYAGKYGFMGCDTFQTVNAIIMVDVEGGRIAYISNLNPFAFQVGSIQNVDHIVSNYVGGVLGATKGVYVQFYYSGKRIRCYTFTSENGSSLKSEEVLDGLAKADTIAELLAACKGNYCV